MEIKYRIIYMDYPLGCLCIEFWMISSQKDKARRGIPWYHNRNEEIWNVTLLTSLWFYPLAGHHVGQIFCSVYPTPDSNKGLYVSVWRGANVSLCVFASEPHCFQWLNSHNVSKCRHKSPLLTGFFTYSHILGWFNVWYFIEESFLNSEKEWVTSRTACGLH